MNYENTAGSVPKTHAGGDDKLSINLAWPNFKNFSIPETDNKQS